MEMGTVTAAGFDESVARALAAPHPDSEKREMLETLGLPTTLLSAIALGVCLKAAAGDVSAAKFIRDTCCEDSAPPEDLNLAPYTDEELRRLLARLQEETP